MTSLAHAERRSTSAEAARPLNAIYPVDIMPGWLRVVAHLNPLTYLVDALRSLMLGSASAYGFGLDMAVQLGVLLVLVAVAARLYPGVA